MHGILTNNMIEIECRRHIFNDVAIIATNLFANPVSDSALATSAADSLFLISTFSQLASAEFNFS